MAAEQVLDVVGREAIPGLIGSHIRAVKDGIDAARRAGLHVDYPDKVWLEFQTATTKVSLKVPWDFSSQKPPDVKND